jgi:Ca-activated chloride channel homolog
MTNPAFNPEDPRLTAFVLGEIDDSDRAAIEQLLETSPEAQAVVKEIEETIGVLKEGLASEPTPELTAEQRAAVEEQLTGGSDGAVALAKSTESTTKRPRSGMFLGSFLSVAALGVLAALVLPAMQSARHNAKMAGDEIAATTARGPAALNSVSGVFAESEESAEFDDRLESLDVAVLTARLNPADDESSTSQEYAEIAKMKLAVEKSLLPREMAEHERQIAQLKTSPATAQLSAEGRNESDFAKRDGTPPAPTAPGKNPTDFDRASQLKDSDGSQAAQRLIADTGSRPRSNGSRQGQVGGGFRLPVADRPTGVSGNSPQSGDGVPKGFRPPPPASGDRAADKVSFSGQLGGAAGEKPANGPQLVGAQSGKPQLESPHTRETIVRNQALVAPGDLANPYLVDTSKRRLKGSGLGGAVVDSPEPASVAAPVPGQVVKTSPTLGGDSAGLRESDRSVALVPSQVESKKRAMSKENGDASGKTKATAGPAPVSESVVLEQVRDREEALISGAETEQLAELSNQIVERQKQTQLAAIDSGATRRGYRRGFGLEGRDLQEQLKKYSVGLSLARTSRGNMSEARKSGYGNEYYAPIVENDFIVPELDDKEKRLSTISVDVDTASYANMRRFLNRDQLPPADSVRIEELVNYFKYNYPEPEGDEPFSVKTELAMCPWQSSHRLAMVGLKAKTIEKAQRPPTNLVFLLDVSGSMRASNKLPLAQQSMRLLVEEMTEDDRVSIVTYASNAGVRLQSTLGSKKQEILNAINGLRAGGSTNGEGGIRMAYDEANRHYFQGGSNRVILCSDGDFNVGKSSDGDLVELIQEKAASGVFLSVFGFGMGNLKDAKLEKLADKGNGHYGYIDNLNEAKKVFQDELVGTLYTVAKDVKLQVEFNPATVGAYRLIGYENRKLAAQDFTDDTKDAGEIGSGHTVTALYEIIPKQVLLSEPEVDGLKYQATAKKPVDEGAKEIVDGDSAPDSADPAIIQPVDQELLTVKLRYKKPDEEVSQPVFQDFVVKDVSIAGKQLSAVSDDLMFAASVASFGMNLRGSKYRGNWGFAEALETAKEAQRDFDQAQRKEFVQLVRQAMRITGQQVGPQPRTNEGTTTRPGELDSTAARIKASVDGKYRRLVKKIEVRDDFQKFGAFNDYGLWDGTEYSGHKDLPPGNWVYVYPNWYIWAEAIVPPVEDRPAVEAAERSKR